MAERTQGEARSVRDGAAESAPTAPHATQPIADAPREATGPARFWSLRRVRRALAACFVLSVGIHYAVGPWTLLPQHGMEFRDVDGTLTIPVDLLEGEPEPPPPPPPPPPPETPPSTSGDRAGVGPDAGHVTRKDAGPHDAGPPDAPEDAPSDAPAADGPIPLVSLEDGGIPDAAGGLADAMIALAADGGEATGGPRDSVGMVGQAGAAQAGVQNVVLIVNMALIRTHPVGAKMGPLLSAIPQWDDFIAGTNVDPVRDTDWVSINGPSMIHTDRDVILVHYSTSDRVVDHAIDIVAHKYDRGGAFDAGVPGVHAMLGHADFAQRVFLRPQPHVLAVVPPDYAHEAARILTHVTIGKSPAKPNEAMRLKLSTPHRPMPDIPESISELRLWIVPRSDGGADVYGAGDTPDPASASAAVTSLKRLVRDQNSLGVQILTHGLLNGIELTDDGSTVRLHLLATRDQLEVVLALVAGKLGVNIPPPPVPSGGKP